jgi:CubicO group peptidase (beta-lactamase class C family)
MERIIGANTVRGDIRVSYYGKAVGDLMADYMEKNNVPAISLAIVQAPYIPLVDGKGIADRETKRLASTNTVFNIGQMTNAFTGVAIMQLKGEGKLSLEDSITKHLPEVPKKWAAISIRDLITHTSGLPSYTGMPGFDYSKEYTPSQIIALVKDQDLLFEPGTQAYASATDHYLLGLIIERVSGMSYEEYVTKNQIERVGLKNTFFISNQDTIQNEVNNGAKPFKHSEFLHNSLFINPTELATGYGESDGKLNPSKKCTWSATFADSGMIASSQDISRWDISLAGDILVKDAKDREFLYGPVKLKNGQIIPGNAGWFFPGHKGLMEIKGNIPGYSSFLSRFTDPKELLCVTLLANKENLADLDILARKIAAAFESSLATPRSSAWSVTMQSPYSVEKTLDHVVEFVKAHGGTIFARIDHAKEAAKVDQKLQPTQVLILGNPAQGTAMMQATPQMALDLPLRIMATQDASNKVWLSFTDPIVLAREYGNDDLQHKEHLKKIHNALLKACQAAILPYSGVPQKSA